ncbi:ORF893 [White spot syndrome virus]|uniref:ORF893 n=1 Tax=White spot syndrome virus TaxID=342409 RepID=A0A2D3I5T9_9VIRU|nr:ORF893 [White spot syndrome virus]
MYCFLATWVNLQRLDLLFQQRTISSSFFVDVLLCLQFFPHFHPRLHFHLHLLLLRHYSQFRSYQSMDPIFSTYRKTIPILLLPVYYLSAK